MSWNKVVKGAMESAKNAAKQGTSKVKPYADKVISAVKKHPYISTGAGIIGAGAIADMLSSDESQFDPQIVEALRAQGLTDEEIMQLLAQQEQGGEQ